MCVEVVEGSGGSTTARSSVGGKEALEGLGASRESRELLVSNLKGSRGDGSWHHVKNHGKS